MNKDKNSLFEKFSKEALEIVDNFEQIGGVSDLLLQINKKFIDDVKPKFKGKYLAHFVFVLEDLIGKKVGNELFKIFLRPVKDIQIASSYYDMKNFFVVTYPDGDEKYELDEKTRRIHIAHELGHLYAHILLKSEDFAKDSLSKDNNTEIIATLVAMVVLRDKRDFYLKAPDKEELSPKTTEELVRDCLQIHRQRKTGISHSS